MHSKPRNTDLSKAKAVSEAAKSVKKSALSAKASIPDSKKVVDSAPRKKQKGQVSEAVCDEHFLYEIIR